MPTIDDLLNYEPLIPEQHVFLIVEAPHESNYEIQDEISNAVQAVINILKHEEAQAESDCQITLSVLTFGTGCVWEEGPAPVPLGDFTWKGCTPSPDCNFGLALDALSTRLTELAKNESSARVHGVPMFWFLMHTFPSDSYQEALCRLKNNNLYRRGYHLALQFKQSDISSFLKEIVGDADAIVDANDEKLIARICDTLNRPYLINYPSEPFDPENLRPIQEPAKYKEAHAYRIPSHELYSTLTSSEELLAIFSTNPEELSDSQMAAWLFERLDLLADATSNKKLDFSKELLVCYRKSISPTGQFQAWIINSEIVVFSEDSIWCAFQHVLFLEGELMVRDTIWNENEESVLFTLFYIVHHEYEKLNVVLSESDVPNDQNIFDNTQSNTEKHPLTESKDKVTIDFLNGTLEELLSGQSITVQKGQVLPCSSREEYTQEIITLSCKEGLCRVENHSGLSLDTYITIKPGDSFLLQLHDYISTDDDNTISPVFIEECSLTPIGWWDVFTLSINCHDGSSHKWEINVDWNHETVINRCLLGPCLPYSAGDPIFKIWHTDDDYRVTNVSPYTFSVIKEFHNGDFLDIETGVAIAKPEGKASLTVFLNISVCKAQPNLVTSTTPEPVPVQDSIVWDDEDLLTW